MTEKTEDKTPEAEQAKAKADKAAESAAVAKKAKSDAAAKAKADKAAERAAASLGDETDGWATDEFVALKVSDTFHISPKNWVGAPPLIVHESKLKDLQKLIADIR